MPVLAVCRWTFSAPDFLYSLPMNSLDNPHAVHAILERLHKLTADAQPKWGTLTPSEMCCHVADSFLGALGDKDLGRVDTLYTRTVMKFVGIRTPMPWPKGLKTAPGMNPRQHGTKPSEFAHDRANLEAAMRRLVAHPAPPGAHPLFGPLSRRDWRQLAWKHMDHHLRQFGL
jgi:hypothetical protein